MDIESLKKFLRNNGLRPNFTYGQNFLVDDFVLQDIVDAGEINSKDIVLEIGPGIGNLTRALAERAKYLLSVEKDPKFFPVLRSVKKDYPKNFRFEVSDFLEFDFVGALKNYAEKNLKYKVVANIPYYITGKILQQLINAKCRPETITILTQKEVAQNICAKAGDLSVLAISVQLFGTPKLIQIVQAKSFYPAPKVDSAILQISLDKKPKVELADEKKFFKIVKACFAGKRKQIHNTLTNNLMLDKNRVLEILSELKIKPTSRPQELSIEDWARLVDKIS
jgi:16S rRNA (adenine1518-N6/adenine1519-N6)-dimethyltransferase